MSIKIPKWNRKEKLSRYLSRMWAKWYPEIDVMYNVKKLEKTEIGRETLKILRKRVEDFKKA